MGSAWLDTTTVYGPVFTIASEPLAVVAADSDDVAAWTYKALAAAAALAAALLAGRLARRRAFAIALVGWNPLLAVHLAGGGHNDAWVGALILAALALSASAALQGAGVLWALAIGVKWVPLLFLALRALESTGDRPAARVRGSPSPLRRSRRRDGALRRRLAARGLPARRQRGARDELRDSAPARAVRRPRRPCARLASRRLSAGSPGSRGKRAGPGPLGLAACLVLVTTPYLAVWYLAWTVPLAAAEEDAAATVACLVLCAYLLPQTIPL